MRSTLLALGLGGWAAAAALSPSLLAQGEFVNFETPQVKPIAVAHVNGKDWLLGCNTPDNSVEPGTRALLRLQLRR